MIAIKTYTISQTAQTLSLSKDALRYYDKIGLVRPQRGENRYRFYSDADLLTLQYVEVMKFAGLSLAEIGAILRNRMGQSEENRQGTLSILQRKSAEIQHKIRLFQELDRMALQAIRLVEAKARPSDMEQVDTMVQGLYQSLGEDEGNEE